MTQRRNRDRGHYNSNNVMNILGLQKYVSTHDYKCFCYEEPDIPKPVFNQRLSTFDSAYCMYSQFVHLLLNIFPVCRGRMGERVSQEQMLFV